MQSLDAAPFLAFVWRPTDIAHALTHMSGSAPVRAVFDLSRADPGAFAPALVEAGAADVKVSCEFFLSQDLLPFLDDTRITTLWVEVHPALSPGVEDSFYQEIRHRAVHPLDSDPGRKGIAFMGPEASFARGFSNRYGEETEQAERLTRTGEFRIRPIKPDIRDEEEIRLVSRVYRECWGSNWGYVPMSDEEVAHTIREFIPIFDPDLAFLLYHGQEPIGLCVIIPDINPLLRRFNGKLGPGALIKKVLYSSEIRGFRGLLFGLKEAYRQLGVPYFVLGYLLETLRAKPQYEYMEMGWNLEDNPGINLLYEEGGSMPCKRYRLYRKDL